MIGQTLGIVVVSISFQMCFIKGDGTMIQLCLQSAQLCILSNDIDMALSYLSEARMYAREGKTQRCKAIAAHCTAAMQALLPVELEIQIKGGYDHDA